MSTPEVPPVGGEVLYESSTSRVVWGDCRDTEVIRSVPDRYGLLCVDPPYGVAYDSGRSTTFTEIEGDDGSVDWASVLAEWVGPDGTQSRGLADARHVYVFGYRPDELQGPLRLGGSAELIWDKQKTGMGNLVHPWGPAHEPITFGVHVKRPSDRAKGGGRLSARLRRGSVLSYPRPNGGSAVRHPNEKPVPLMAELIESSTVRGDLVVDPCAGSGSTLVAAVLLGRRAWGVEIDRANAVQTAERVQAAEAVAASQMTC
ncbi:DNA-methyltransferase [Streptomyces sp. NPDC058375]|uniref:DNA-methyltransferase n=1 Tax=Streptomyces sp. NPDC058375 TaxID=3346467 RepID=UPI003651AA47